MRVAAADRFAKFSHLLLEPLGRYLRTMDAAPGQHEGVQVIALYVVIDQTLIRSHSLSDLVDYHLLY